MTSAAPHLVLFFTRNTSLAAWDEGGIFSRETALYERLADQGIRVTFATYGGQRDWELAKRIPGIHVVSNHWNLPADRYRALLTHWYPLFWGPRAILKSNQVKGADVALSAATRFRRPFVARCGYLHSEFSEREHGNESEHARDARRLEERVFHGATRVSVTTAAMAERITRSYALDSCRVCVVPNYVDTQLFSPRIREMSAQDAGGRRTKLRIVFVGRLVPQKNLAALMQAISDLDVELLVVGDGVLMPELRAVADTSHLLVKFVGNVSNAGLPELFAGVDLFVLPSLYEGHPKALIEAMACGLPVVGTDVPGIREIIHHGENGWLSGVTALELRSAIQVLLEDRALRRRLGEAGRQYVADHFSLDRVVEAELAMLCQMSEQESR